MSPVSSHAALIATLPPLAGIVTMLDKNMQIACILNGNSDPHHMSIRPQQLERLKKSFILRTTEDRQWQHLKSPQALVVWQKERHAWLNPQHVYQKLPIIVQTLEAQGLHADLQVTQQQVLTLEQHLQQVLAPLKKHGVIMQHGAWKNVFEQYGVPVHLILEKGHHGHVSPQRLQKALNILDQKNKVWLIGDQQHDTDSLRWLRSKREYAPLLILDSLGSCNTSWLHLMQDNIQRIESLQ